MFIHFYIKLARDLILVSKTNYRLLDSLFSKRLVKHTPEVWPLCHRILCISLTNLSHRNIT
jgi:hypothetical protein